MSRAFGGQSSFFGTSGAEALTWQKSSPFQRRINRLAIESDSVERVSRLVPPSDVLDK